MATRKAQPARPLQANLTPDQMRAAIPKLERRIAELQAFDPATVNARNDPRIGVIDNKLEQTIADVFGVDTVEFFRYQPRSIDTGSVYFGADLPLHEVRQGLVDGVAEQVANLQSIIDVLKERLDDGEETPSSKARRAFGDLDLQSDVARECSKLFEDGHYAQAVETACKVLDMLVQLRSMRTDVNGTALMRLVFSSKAPILKFNDQQNDSEKSEQEGMMHLYEGAMMALRNPRAHGVTQDHPERAVEYLSFVSMLARALDRTQRA
ncbi:MULTISPECIES: TIGR02391 family protein [Burkholderia cepacia complex]|uniref:TIGR02391 family protein n=1 Tax=Burkholderia cepacia complex TaxID=87882 RepID=UPI00157681F2|nr:MULTISPECIES: TIGR02391 family protein [Burkholderia cepacia complex]MBR8212863.1 TIGR02391 family protein [Burkholderia cenocepacia]NTZ07195.1 TIGR02391 family protein [Burkholderia metallica]